jgi:hypothetical protein
VPESFYREPDKDYNGPTDKSGRAVYGKRNPDALINDRCKRLFQRQLSGLPARQLVLEHASRESIAENTAWRDWKKVTEWNEAGWNEERETILSRIQAMRMKIIDQAVRKGQLQTAMMGLKDLQETLLGDTNNGESTVKLNINIESPDK